MIGYITIGTNNLERAGKFYDALLAEIGGAREMEEEGKWISYASNPPVPSICITVPYDRNPATAGNGMTVGLTMRSPAEVDSFHKKAMELGAKNEGEPGPREDNAYYAGYFRDLDGNYFSAYWM